MKIKNYIIFGILIVAALLRLYKLDATPPALTPDEASLGYNAYSILKTGRDEYGQILPVIFKSFGDYKPGLYVYAAIPFIATFGLNEFSTRLPSAIAGIAIVYLIYLIVRKLKNQGSNLDVLVAFVASINPWLIYFSRGAWEANLSLMLTLFGIYFFLRALTINKFVIYSSVSFALTFVTYQGAKLSTTLVMFILTAVFWKESKRLLKQTKLLVISAVLGLLIVLPVIASLLGGKTGRLTVFSVFSYPRPIEYTQAFLNEGREKIGGLSYYLFHSEALNFARGVAGRWFNHFSGKFLFFEGDYQNPRHSAPNSGMMLLFDIVLLPLGFVYLIRSKKLPVKFKNFVILWLILSPLPAVLSRDQVQGVRALNMAVPLVIVSVMGLYYLLLIIRKSVFKISFNMLLSTCYFVSLLYFFDSYFVHLNKHNAKYWYYGYKQMVQKVAAIQNDYDRILIQQSYDQPYVYFLFYASQANSGTYITPEEYQKSSNLVRDGIDVGYVERVGNIEFRDISWPPPVRAGEKTLIAGNPIAIPPSFSTTEFNLIEEIKMPDNFTTAFGIIESK